MVSAHPALDFNARRLQALSELFRAPDDFCGALHGARPDGLLSQIASGDVARGSLYPAGVHDKSPFPLFRRFGYECPPTNIGDGTTGS